jgi:formylglycine-generating enzyme required for sulfatase activity
VIDDAAHLREQKQSQPAQEELTRAAEADQSRLEEQPPGKVEAAVDSAPEQPRLKTTDPRKTTRLDKPVSTLVNPSLSSAMLDVEESRLGIGQSTIGIDPFSETGARSFSNIDARPRRKRNRGLMVVFACLAVLLIGVGFGGYYLLRSRLFRPAKTIPSEPVNEAPIKSNLIQIPGGTFQMGRNNSAPAEGPAHSVTVQPFFMDKTEVTNADYQQFVRDTNYAPPAHWGGVKPPEGSQLLPVSNVSYKDAMAFAAWRSQKDGVTYRLPTEEEWEYAARNGQKENLYPWGDQWLDGQANTEEAGIKAAQAVGTYPGGSNSWGVEDLIGNVWEWTSSKYSLYKGSAHQPNPDYQDQIVIRGGGYASSRTGTLQVSGTMREWVKPDYLNPLLGFRLVRSAQ